MGREIRKVPEDWQHPRDENGDYKPMYDTTYEDACKEYSTNFVGWIIGKYPENGKRHGCNYFWEYVGNPPNKEHDTYRPEFESKPTHYQVYECTTEGTPISPIFPQRWAAEHWLRTYTDKDIID